MADKKSKEEAKYGPGHAHGDHCGVCRHFIAPHTCAIVRGEVERMGWCKYFSRKRGGRYAERSVNRG